MHFVSIKDKNLLINNEVFKYTNQIKIVHDNDEICILSSKDSRSVYYDAPKGQILEVYLKVQNDWLYYENLAYSYVTMKVSQDQVEKFLLDRRDLIKEILDYEISI